MYHQNESESYCLNSLEKLELAKAERLKIMKIDTENPNASPFKAM
jgi:hypothetical protein